MEPEPQPPLKSDAPPPIDPVFPFCHHPRSAHVEERFGRHLAYSATHPAYNGSTGPCHTVDTEAHTPPASPEEERERERKRAGAELLEKRRVETTRAVAPGGVT